MGNTLDILALEPFYGGIRRVMLETLIRRSRHRWTLLKLPPRRIERRLSAAAIWFAEQLSRHWVGRVDVLFTSEAMNLADLVHRVPELAGKPSVAYFHSNQLPDPWSTVEQLHDVVNLSTATTCTEMWFNSLYHLRNFLSRASALVERHPELAGRNPMPQIMQKARLMPPPVETSLAFDAAMQRSQRQPRTIFFDTREADTNLLNEVFASLSGMGEPFSLVTVGPVDELKNELPRRTVSESDERAQFRALHEAGIILSGKPNAACDHHMVRALSAGCWPIAPQLGVYPEILPERMHTPCLYDGTPEGLLNHLLDAWNFERVGGYQEELDAILHQFNPLSACRAIDQRLEELAAMQR